MSALAFTLVCIQCFPVILCSVKFNNRPIIGILAQDVDGLKREYWPNDNVTSYIAASYVKYVESGGARAVPILINQPQDYYRNVTSQINGVLFPGGATLFNGSGLGYAGEIIYQLALEMNKNGDYFPVWGTCLGFELIGYLHANKTDWRSNCMSVDVSLPLQMTSGVADSEIRSAVIMTILDWKASKMFGDAPHDVIYSLTKENVTANYHLFCYTPQNFYMHGFNDSFRILSFNEDENGLVFISAMESYSFPIYGIQFHPEKNSFEWKPSKKGIPHTKSAVVVNQYFANFLVNEEEEEYLIYNYSPYYTGAKGSSFDQCYFFE